MRDVLRVVPIIVDRAKEATGNIITNATFLLSSGRQSCWYYVRRLTSIEPIGNCSLKLACIVAACIICS